MSSPDEDVTRKPLTSHASGLEGKTTSRPDLDMTRASLLGKGEIVKPTPQNLNKLKIKDEEATILSSPDLYASDEILKEPPKVNYEGRLVQCEYSRSPTRMKGAGRTVTCRLDQGVNRGLLTPCTSIIEGSATSGPD